MATLLFFGKLADLARTRIRLMEIEPGGASMINLIEAVKHLDPRLGAALDQSSVRYAVNQEIVEKTRIITNDDEIAFLPPVSGG